MADQTTRTRTEKSMRVALTTIAAGPEGVAKPGTIMDLPESVAKQWIDSRFARPLDRESDKKAPVGFRPAGETSK